jgi:DNA helicase-2/ATP-dependent DNA helicase PcrA
MDASKTKILVGPPGTGKTTRLLGIMEEEMSAGLDPRRVGFVSFTKKATQVAKSRALDKFSFDEKDLPYFRTVHSLAFHQMGLKRDQVMQHSHFSELGDMLGMEFRSSKKVDEGGTYGMSKDERLAFLEGLSRVKLEPLSKTWSDANEDDVDWFELERYGRALAQYKKSRMVLDYTDIVTEFVARGHLYAPNIDVLFVDEAQDLSPIQWQAMRILASKAQRIYVAGDDDQALFEWAGADVNAFITLPGTVQVLDESHRIPLEVHKVAESVVSQIKNRRPKKYKPRSAKGSLNWYSDPEEVDMSSGTWLLLARNGYMLQQLEESCISNGFSFESVGNSPLQSDSLRAVKSWEILRKGNVVTVDDVLVVAKYVTAGRGMGRKTRDLLRKSDPQEFVSMADLKQRFEFTSDAIWHEALDKIPESERVFFIAARKRGETLTKKPRIRISTIHSAKGDEADNVLLMTDVSHRTFENMGKDPDGEHRVFYVGVTRCKEALHIVQPRTNLFFEL